jgi:hypothetical protein
MTNSLSVTFKVVLSLCMAAAFIGTTLRYKQQSSPSASVVESLKKKALRGLKGVNSNSASSDEHRQLQYFVQGGGGGSANLYYSAAVKSEALTDAYSASSGSGEVKGGGSASIIGPSGSAAAGGRGGGVIKGGFGLYAFNGADAYAAGGGQVAGYGGGSGQYFPGQNAPNSKVGGEEDTNGAGFITVLEEEDGSTGGGAGAIAFAQGAGFGNLTAKNPGQFAKGNATGSTTAFGIGYGQGANSEGTAGGTADVVANGAGGGGGQAGVAPTINANAANTPNGQGGQVTFNAVGFGSASALGGGYIGADPKVPQPYFPAFVIPGFPANNPGIGRSP